MLLRAFQNQQFYGEGSNLERFRRLLFFCFRNGVVIDDKSTEAVINNVNDRHNIILIDEEDEGVYDCQASNHVGQAKKSLNVSGIWGTHISQDMEEFISFFDRKDTIIFSGSKCDSKFNSIFKMDNGDDYGGVFEVKICTEEINKEDKILSMGNEK